MASKSIKLCLPLFLSLLTYSTAELGQPKETNMTLYFQDYAGGPNSTVIDITGGQSGEPFNFTRFGAVFLFDDIITESSEESSAQIGRGQTQYVISSQDGLNAYLSMSILFNNGEYNGSTLILQGDIFQFDPQWELAVVGGTRKFRLARGYATFETIYYERYYYVLQSNVTVLNYKACVLSTI